MHIFQKTLIILLISILISVLIWIYFGFWYFILFFAFIFVIIPFLWNYYVKLKYEKQKKDNGILFEEKVIYKGEIHNHIKTDKYELLIPIKKDMEYKDNSN